MQSGLHEGGEEQEKNWVQIKVPTGLRTMEAENHVRGKVLPHWSQYQKNMGTRMLMTSGL